MWTRVCVCILCNNTSSLGVYSLFWHLSRDKHFLLINVHLSASPFSFVSEIPLQYFLNMQALPFPFSFFHSLLVGAYQHCSHFLAFPVQSRYLHFKWEIYFSDMQMNWFELCIYSGLLTQQQLQPVRKHWMKMLLEQYNEKYNHGRHLHAVFLILKKFSVL